MQKNVETFIGCDSAYEDASIVLFGAPFDGTTSYRPGTRFGPSAIRHESYGLETYSPYQDRDLTDYKVFDGGDLELCFGNPRKVLDDIKETVTKILSDRKLPLMIGGEHLVTLGAMEAVIEKYPEVHIIHFDAHTDLREEYLGERLSHASVIRRCHDLTGDGKIFQFGIRSGEREEFYWAAKGHTTLRKFDFEGLNEVLESLKETPVYITLDLDVLDPSCFPGTGTVEAGGVDFMTLIEAVKKIGTLHQIVGVDINELAPNLDPSGASTALACKVVRELILAIAGK